MVNVPEQSFRLESIHWEENGAEKWALGILDRGDRKAGEMMYLYSRSRSSRDNAMAVRGVMLCEMDTAVSSESHAFEEAFDGEINFTTLWTAQRAGRQICTSQARGTACNGMQVRCIGPRDWPISTAVAAVEESLTNAWRK